MTISRRNRNPASPIPPSATVLGGSNPLLQYLVSQAAEPQARTPSSAFHRHLTDLAVATLASGSQIAGSIEAHKSTITTELKAIQDKLDTTNDHLGSIEDNTETEEHDDDDVLSDNQKTCLRGINRVEQILLDKEPENDPVEKAEQNNIALQLFANDSLGKAAFESFQSFDLAKEWTNLSAPFADPDTAESQRSVRLRACQVLRYAVLNASST
jgi:hypothetical protein